MGAIVAVIGSRAKTELAERLKPMLQRSRIVVRLIGSWLVWFGDAVIPWRGAKSATFRCDAIFVTISMRVKVMEIGNNQDLTNAGYCPPARQLVDSGLGGRRPYQKPSLNKLRIESIVRAAPGSGGDANGPEES